MDNTRLANIIFSLGIKIPQNRYESICEDIKSNTLSFDDCVIKYKLKESVMDKIVFVLGDSTKVFISEEIFNEIKMLNTDMDVLRKYMSENYTNFKEIIGLINDNK